MVKIEDRYQKPMGDERVFIYFHLLVFPLLPRVQCGLVSPRVIVILELTTLCTCTMFHANRELPPAIVIRALGEADPDDLGITR